jgi:hypothetical protein
MPSEIGSSVINPASFVRPSPQQAQIELRARDAAQGSGATAEPASAGDAESLIQAPDAGTRGQATENQLASGRDAASRPGAGADTRRPGPPEGGVGGNVDVLI